MEIADVVKKHNSELKKLSNSIGEIYDRHLLNSPCNKLYKKNNIMDFNITFREDIDLGEDLLFNVEYLSTGKIQRTYILEDSIYFYRAQSFGTLCTRYDSNYFRNQIEQFNSVIQLFHLLKFNLKQSKLYSNYDVIVRNSPYYYWKKAPKYKLRRANEVLKSKEYKECLERRKDSMHVLTWHIYNSGNFLLVLLVEKLYAIIHR